MSSLMKSGHLNISGFNEVVMSSKIKGINVETKPNDFPILGGEFMGKPLVLADQKGIKNWSKNAPSNFHIHAHNFSCVSRGLRWWEKTITPNMVEIHSAKELVDSLLVSGDRLVVVDFYSPGCGGCKPLHPKICQLAEAYPNAKFLKVNYEELKTMCHSLHVYVLPFFRFYRGSEGRLCSFSCTNATIKKLKDALAKHGADRCCLGPAKGLDESELMGLVSVGELHISSIYPSEKKRVDDLMLRSNVSPGVWINSSYKMDVKEETAMF